MTFAPENIAPVTEDLRAENFDATLDVIKGIEHINMVDGKLDAGVNVGPADWVMRNATGFGLSASGAGVGNVYPVVTGNNQYDAIATGNVTVAQGGGFIYRTKKFASGAYTIGQNLTVKNGSTVPEAAGSGDAIVARVWTYDSANQVMEIEVLNR